MTKYITLFFSLLLVTLPTLGSSFIQNIHHPRIMHAINQNTVVHDDDENNDIPSVIDHPVLRQVYPSLLKHTKEYGNPNIPLGTSEGKFCKTLRRLFMQNKLSSGEVQLLEEMKFRLSDLEEIYEEADFDEIVIRLQLYKEEYGHMQVPKKYHVDPELGAWVAMARRISSSIEPTKRKILDDIGFEWKSNRKCGSNFMKNLRDIDHKIGSMSTDHIDEKIALLNKDEKKWLNAQKLACEKGNLSEARVQYVENIISDWRNIDY